MKNKMPEWVIEKQEDLLTLNNNSFIGGLPSLLNSKIVFKGTGNILFCEEGVTLKNASITFEKDNALAVIRKTKHPLKLNLHVWNDSVFYLGSNSFINAGGISAVISERKKAIIGDDALFSREIWLRTSDAHLVYDCQTHNRINYSKDILIGDHVWIGQNVFILKGTTIGSGSIIGAGAICAGKKIPSNTSWAGNPAKLIATNVFFSKKGTSRFTAEDTKRFAHLKKNDFIFASEKEDLFPVLSDLIDSKSTSADKLDVLLDFFEQHTDKNRFAIPYNEGSGSRSPKNKSILAKLKALLNHR